MLADLVGCSISGAVGLVGGLLKFFKEKSHELELHKTSLIAKQNSEFNERAHDISDTNRKITQRWLSFLLIGIYAGVPLLTWGAAVFGHPVEVSLPYMQVYGGIVGFFKGHTMLVWQKTQGMVILPTTYEMATFVATFWFGATKL